MEDDAEAACGAILPARARGIVMFTNKRENRGLNAVPKRLLAAVAVLAIAALLLAAVPAAMQDSDAADEVAVTYDESKLTVTNTATGVKIVTDETVAVNTGVTITIKANPAEGQSVKLNKVVEGKKTALPITDNKATTTVDAATEFELIVGHKITVQSGLEVKNGAELLATGDVVADGTSLTFAKAASVTDAAECKVKITVGETPEVKALSESYSMGDSDVRFDLVKFYSISAEDGIIVETGDPASAITGGQNYEAGTVLLVSIDETKINAEGRITVPAGKMPKVVPDVNDKGQYTLNANVEFKIELIEKEFTDEDNITIGDHVKSREYAENQQVTMYKETWIEKNETVIIKGKLIVPEGINVTIREGATLVILGTADIKGNLIIESGEDDNGNPVIGKLVVPGEATISGRLDISGQVIAGTWNYTENKADKFEPNNPGRITFATGSDATIGEKGTIEGDIVIQEDATLTIAGGIQDVSETEKTKFEVAGKLIVDSSVITGGFEVELKDNGSVALNRVALGSTVSSDSTKGTGTITIKDSGSVLWNKANTEPANPAVKVDANPNKVVITAKSELEATPAIPAGEIKSGTTVSGIVASAEMLPVTVVAEKDSDAGSSKENVGLQRHASVLSISGNVTLQYAYEYNGEDDVQFSSKSMDATITVTGKGTQAYAKVGSAFSIGEGVTANFENVRIGASVAIGNKAAVNLSGNTVVEGNITVAAGGVLHNGGTMDVKATIDATAKATGTAVFNNDSGSKIKVTGEGAIRLINKTIPSADISAAFYATKSGADTINNYVTIDAAMKVLSGGDVKVIEIYGDQTLTESAEIPADTTVHLNGGELTIGTKDNRDVVLTVKRSSGSSNGLKGTAGSTVDVLGTLDAERMVNVENTLRSGNNITSDVFSSTVDDKGRVNTEGAAKWTNIYTALIQAQSGQTVQVHKVDGIDDLTTVTIKEGVTLDANGKPIKVMNRHTLTVNGTLDLTKSGSRIELSPEDKDESGRTIAAGSIVVNGYVEYSTDALPITMGSAVYDASGAYYTITEKGVKTLYLTTYVNGAADAPKADSRTVDFKAASGEAIVLGNLTLKGEDGKDVKIIAYADTTARAISMENASFTIRDNSLVDATFTRGSDSVAVKGQVGPTDLIISTDKIGTTAVMTVAGGINDYAVNSKGEAVAVDEAGAVAFSTSVSFIGNIYMLAELNLTVDKVAVTGNLVINGPKGSSAAPTTLTIERDMDVTGTVDIKNGSTVTVGKTLTVSGTITVSDGKLDASKATVTVSSGASIDASAKDSTGTVSIASFSANILYVGVTAGDFIKTTGADPASVKGEATIGAYVLASPDAVLPEKITKEDGDYIGTKFMVEGKDYLRSYTTPSNASALKISAVTAKVVDKKFIGWYSDVLKKNSNDEANKNVTIGTTGWETVSASLNPYIYTIEVSTDGGINYITAGGKLLTSVPGKGDTYAISGLEKGTYQLAISAKTGYDVSKVKIYNEKNEVTSMAVTVGGETSEKTYRFSMIGSEPAGSSDSSKDIVEAIDKNTEAVKGQSNGSDPGLTDILLIILVVLIAIMAVIVALRLMRS